METKKLNESSQPALKFAGVLGTVGGFVGTLTEILKLKTSKITLKGGIVYVGNPCH